MNALLTASVAAVVGAISPGEHHHSSQLGRLSFESTCDLRARASLEEGLGWLHSFEYEQAAQSFGVAAAADPSCGIAYWGVAMSYYHPLWVPPTSAEMERGKRAIANAKAAGAKSQREKDYIAALDSFYRDSETVGHKSRALAYSAAMERLHARYPDDREAAVFYALSLIAAGTMDRDPTFAKEKQAAAILNKVLALNPDHPGVAHYLIHSFDYPPLAELALPAARRYASIAPASAHAQHMPSHIFTRLGLWDESIRSNLASQEAAEVLTKAKGFPGASRERLHAMDYLAYAYLQTGQDSRAEGVLADLNAIKEVDEPVFSVAYAATAIPARLVLERKMWREAASLELPDNVRSLAPLAKFPWAEAHLHFARAIGAAHIGNISLARGEVATLSTIEQALVIPPGTYDWRKSVRIERETAEAWLAYAEGRKDDALEIMRAAADLDDASEKHPVTPGAILPAREQLGELLLELRKPADAQEAFEVSLKRAPKRLAGFYGAARAARLAGHASAANHHFAELVELTKGGESERTEIKEARAFTPLQAAR
ncbi:MAG TPA: hypothetical protein VIZ66_02480 [Sphingomicrobium sp.]